MNQAEFAGLCDVSPMQISKYKAAGRLAFTGKKVDARQSLQQLEGHLDENKRRAALAKLDNQAKVAGAPSAENVIDLKSGEPPEASGWKARGDMFKAKEAELSYHERVGALLDSAEIAAAIEAVIADFWTETEQRVKLKAAEYASDLKIDATQAARLRSLMLRDNRELRADYARVCRAAEKRFLSAAAAVA